MALLLGPQAGTLPAHGPRRGCLPLAARGTLHPGPSLRLSPWDLAIPSVEQADGAHCTSRANEVVGVTGEKGAGTRLQETREAP